jgi:hypothetical protein
MLFIFTLIVFQSHFSQAKQSLLSNEQISTLANNYMLMAGYVDLLKDVTHNLPLDKITLNNMKIFDNRIAVNESIEEIQRLTIYEIEATDLYLMIDDEEKMQVLIFRKRNLKFLRDETKATLEMIRNDYLTIDNNEIVSLYDNANRLLTPLLSAFDGNLAVYESINIKTGI